MRIGHGYDVHRLVEGRACIIGGVNIPYEKGLLGHSDADVLTHAVMDALLGAAALGDIGHLFPDNDDAFLGADSLLLLRRVNSVLKEHGWKLGNLDATVVAQAPKRRRTSYRCGRTSRTAWRRIFRASASRQRRRNTWALPAPARELRHMRYACSKQFECSDSHSRFSRFVGIFHALL